MVTNMDCLNTDFLLDSYSYELPEDRIAQFPSGERDGSRLLVMSREPETGEVDCQPFLKDAHFGELADYLPPGALIIANDSKVLPARIIGKRPGGGGLEFLLLTPLPLLMAGARLEKGLDMAAGMDAEYGAVAECLLRPSGKTRIGSVLDICPGLAVKVLKKGGFGRHEVLLAWRGDLERIFLRHGQPPLPPYVRRAPALDDLQRYQTVYAKKTGSVAAPTAGLHFSENLRLNLAERGFEWLELTLYVGYGTFSPVREDDIRRHEMHSEYAIIPQDAAFAVNRAKREGRPIVAVGTTTLRALEGAASVLEEFGPYSGWIDIFLYPGSKFKIVDCLITNFHLPRSTLLMLVSAFAGRRRILNAYAHAMESGYRFFSYGDAMLIR